MALSAECGHCFRVYKNLPDAALGKAFKCKSCGEPVRVEAPNSTEESFADLAPAPSVGPRPKAAKPKAAPAEPTVIKKIGPALVTVICVALVGLKIYGRATRPQRRDSDQMVANAPVQQNLSVATESPIEQEQIKSEDLVIESSEVSPLTLAGVKNYTPTNSQGSAKKDLVDSDLPDNDLTMRKQAYVEMLKSSSDAGLLIPIVSGMNESEFAVLEEGFQSPALASFITSNLGGALFEVPFGFEIDDDELLRKRKYLMVKILGAPDSLPWMVAMAGPIERLNLKEYRTLEKQLAHTALDDLRRSMTIGPFKIPDLQPEEITIGEDGYRFPARVEEAVLSRARKSVEHMLDRFEN